MTPQYAREGTSPAARQWIHEVLILIAIFSMSETDFFLRYIYRNAC